MGREQPNPRRLFEYLQEIHPGIFRGLRIIKTTSGVVPIGMRSRTYGDRALLVGDAACHVKPISGGGLYFGLRGAAICAETAIAALTADELRRGFPVILPAVLGVDDRVGDPVRVASPGGVPGDG